RRDDRDQRDRGDREDESIQHASSDHTTRTETVCTARASLTEPHPVRIIPRPGPKVTKRRASSCTPSSRDDTSQNVDAIGKFDLGSNFFSSSSLLVFRS